MVGIVSSQLQTEICLYRGTDVRGTCGVNTPAAILILMLNNPIRGLLKARGIARSQQRVEQNVIRLEGGIRFEFSAPIAFVVLRGEEELAGGLRRGS
jgi:hypothetical protein